MTKLPSGRWRARYTVPGSTQLWVNAPMTFTKKDDAETWLARQRADIADGIVRPKTVSSRIALRQYATGWLEERRNSRGEPLRPSTLRTYEQYLTKYIYPTLGDVALPKITADTVKAWHRDLAPGKPTIRALVYAFLRSMLATAVEDEIIAANPCRIRGAGSTRPAARKAIATPAQVDELASAMPERLALAVLLGAWCQVRNGEAMELRRKDVTPAALSISRGVTWANGQPHVGPPKTGAGVRVIAVPPHLAQPITDHLKHHANPGPDGLLFPAAPGRDRQMHQSTFSYYLAEAVKKTTLPAGFRFHWLRHTGLTWAAQTGATVGELRARAGHSTPNIAMLYQHATTTRDQALAAALSKIATGGDESGAR
ncbi:MAG: site-specific integrase [Cellulomonas sp.]|nr:site-specific integrase [Cellulomonas sp.]